MHDMRPWVQWCLKHKLSFIVLITWALVSPFYLAAGAWFGLTEAASQWASEWRDVRAAARQTKGGGNGE